MVAQKVAQKQVATPKEQQRRLRQGAEAVQAQPQQAPVQTAEQAQNEYLDHMADELGLSPDDLRAEGNAPPTAINLDEALADTVIPLRYWDYRLQEVADATQPETNATTKRWVRIGQARIELQADIYPDVQLRALKLANRVKDLTLVEQVAEMLACITLAWQETEPGVTAELVKRRLGTYERITALYTQLFNPASRP